MDDSVVQRLIAVTEQAALACAPWVGRGDRKAADRAATEAMRAAFQDVPVRGTVVIGEGERDSAPMLYIGEDLGAGGPAIDIAVDPLEGTNLCAKGEDGAVAVLAVGPRGTLLHAPDAYMDKIAAPKGVTGIDLDRSPEENVRAVAKALNKPIDEVGVLVMDRERHGELIAELKRLGVRLILISDGDVMGAIRAALPGTEVDLLLGIGAAPEGVLAASAIKNLGGFFQGRLWFGDLAGEEFLERAKEMGVEDPDKKLELDDLVQGESVFVATAVTDTDFGQGVRKGVTHTLLIHDGKMETIRREHDGTA